MEFLKLLEILQRRKWLIIVMSFAFFFTVIILTSLITPTYKVKTKLLISPSDTLSSLLSTLGLRGAAKATSSSDEYETYIALAKTKPLLNKLISSLGLRDRYGNVMKSKKLIKRSFIVNKLFPQPYLKVDQHEDADILEIVSTSSDSLEAANMSNKLAELYIEDRVAMARKEYKAAKVFIENKIQNVKEYYYKSLSDLKDFRIKESYINLDEETNVLISKIYELKSELQDIKTEIGTLKNKILQAKEELFERDEYKKESEELVLNEQIENLKTKLNNSLLSIAGKSASLTKKHVDYKALEKQIETARKLIAKEADIVLKKQKFAIDPIYEELSSEIVQDCISLEVAKTKINLVKAYIGEYQGELFNTAVRYTNNSKLTSAIEINEEIYKNLQSYLTYIGIAEAITISNIRIVEPSTRPDKPDFPKKTLKYFLAIFFGPLSAFMLAFFIEYIDNTIKSSEEAALIESAPLLGTIPKTKSLSNCSLISKLKPTSPLVDIFRMIRQDIKYSEGVEQLKSFVVTSTVESEGKSTIASNISIVMGMEGQRIILVDLNLRRPSLHTFFDLSNQVGITNIFNDELTLEDAIANTGIEGINLLPCGPIPFDPNRILESKRMLDIINKLKISFDVVIIDTPAALFINDPIIIGRLADGVLYIIESGKVTLSMVGNVKKRMTNAGLNFIGIILNKFKSYQPYLH